MKKPAFQIGDKVTVVNPDFFIRCGYTLTLAECVDKVEALHKEKINRFIIELGYPFTYDTLNYNQFMYSGDYDNLFNKILMAVAGQYIRDQKFGGPERKIFTERREKLVNTEDWTIIGKKRVKTGTYSSGFYSGGQWDGEGEWNGPYLSNEQSHTILEIKSPHLGLFEDSLFIESANVTKLI